ncbi:hypothetical protein [Nonomuraea endophytica]|uniref:hypothetical protein n=1 Tax=Nonomuraea endophytica TaxID=714136 RepID=UPI0037C54873
MSTETVMWVAVIVGVMMVVGLFLLRRRRGRTRSDPLNGQPLDLDSRRGYADRWAAVQERFVNEPSPAVSEADLLVRAVMAKSGYTTEDFVRQVSELSPRHRHALEHYGQAHEISARATGSWVSIQELRQAMTHYHALFDDLLGGDEPALQARPATPEPRTLPRGTAAPRQ